VSKKNKTMAKNMKLIRKYKAFTLAELLATIAIILIISAVSWAMLNSTSKQNDVNNVCSQIAAKINKARNYALTGKTLSDGTVPNCVAFRLRNDTTPKWMNILGYDKGGNPTPYDSEVTNFTSDISFDSSHSIYYKIPTGEMCGSQFCTSSGSLLVITISSGDSSVAKTLTVTPSSASCQ
jgi:prepilin-type N-terminal cleavage/methylation domain-containing protein